MYYGVTKGISCERSISKGESKVGLKLSVCLYVSRKRDRRNDVAQGNKRTRDLWHRVIHKLRCHCARFDVPTEMLMKYPQILEILILYWFN